MTEDTREIGVKVSMREIFVEVQRQGRLLERIANSLPTSKQQIEDHEKRIRALERRVAFAVGGFGLAAAVMPFIVRLIP